MVDVVRITTYAVMFLAAGPSHQVHAGQWPLVVTGIAAAFSGVMIGKRYLRKVTMNTVQTITGIFLLGIAIALGSGIM
jgi:uncharacterized membrane protein YfcA